MYLLVLMEVLLCRVDLSYVFHVEPTIVIISRVWCVVCEDLLR